MRAALAALTLCLLLAGSAAAARRPSRSESGSIRSAVAGFIAIPRSPAAKDNEIVSIWVSTLDARYASVRLNSRSAGPSDLVLHLSMGTWFPEQFGSSLNCTAAPKAVLAELKVGCTPPGATAWIRNCGPLVSAPASVILTCADANYELASLRWHGWGHATATATGRARANDCGPDCAAGHFHSYAVTVSATRLSRCGKARVYRRLTISYARHRPTGIARRDVHALGC